MSRFTVFVGIAALVAACGPKGSRNGNGGNGGSGGSGNGTVDAPACAASMVTAQQIPLDLYVMLDQSGSMGDNVTNGGTKWQAVTGALNTFVNQPGLDGVSVGLQYFGIPPANTATCSAITCTTDADCGPAACGPCLVGVCTGAISQGGDSCTASDYAMPAVEIAPLPGVGSAITSSMAGHTPTTGTPTSAALQGAIDHATSWAQSHAGDAVAVVLATDGNPEECDTTLSDIDNIASAGAAATPKILTFVIGVGSLLSNLNGIAAAGGTNAAYLVDTGGNVNQQFLDAMNMIRHSALGCQYQIPLPANGTPDYQQVNVVYTPGNGGAAETFPYVTSQANCPANGDGWYYNDPNNPTQIILCDSTCTKVEADMQGSVGITLGCATVIE